LLRIFPQGSFDSIFWNAVCTIPLVTRLVTLREAPRVTIADWKVIVGRITGKLDVIPADPNQRYYFRLADDPLKTPQCRDQWSS
jgi:hypothetical protein